MNTKTTTSTPIDFTNMWYAIDAPMQPLTPDWLIAGLLERGGFLLLTGATADIRSGVAVDMFVALRGGADWLRLETLQCAVEYVKTHDRHVSYFDINGIDTTDGINLSKESAADIIIIDDLDAFAEDDKREAALKLDQFAARNRVAVVALTDKPLDGFDYLHIHRDRFQARWSQAVLESCRDDEACRIDVTLSMTDDELFLVS